MADNYTWEDAVELSESGIGMGPGNVGLIYGTHTNPLACAGGACSGWERQTSDSENWQQKATSMGGAGFHFPLVLRRGAAQRDEIKNLEAMLQEYTGPEGTYIRWILRNKINHFKKIEASIRGLNYREGAFDNPMPIPDWMEPFITTTTVQPEVPEGMKGRRQFTKPKTTMGLRPLGAQTELNPEQLTQMAAFLSAQKGWDLQSQSDLGRFWEPYRRESEGMFSQATRQAPRWATAQQR